MFLENDIRQTRIYQELREELSEELREQLREECLKEGMEKDIERGMERGIEAERQRSIAKMAASKMSAAAIADLLGLDVDLVRKEMAKNQS